MDYQKAKDIRSKSFSDLMTDKLTGGQGIGSSLRQTLSEKTKAKMTGIRETFDPMNIVKAMTFGSKLGPALYGRMMGRSKEDINYFTGKKTRGPGKNKTPGQIDSSSDSMAVEALGLIYRLMLRNIEDEKTRSEEEKNSLEEKDSEEELRNQELIKALTARRKKEKPKKEKPTEPEKKVEEEKKKEKKVAKKPAEKAPPKEAQKAPEKVPTKEAAKPPTAKPEAPAKPISTAAKVGIGAVAIGAPLGALSAQFESSKAGPAAIGYDSTGGTSYGTYQLASKKGVVKEFLSYMSNINPEWTKRLSSAGDPNTGSTKGDFPDTWKKIAAEDPKEFNKIQHDFIQLKHYQPTVNSLAKIGYDVESQPEAIKNVVWSTAVQHGSGGASSIFKQAIKQAGGVDAKPEKIISNVYEIRRTKFGSSTAEVQASVNKRFDTESKMAVDMLNNSGSKIDQASKENKDLKQSLNNDRPKQTIVNNTSVSAEKKETSTTSNQSVDDRPAYLRKKG